MNYLDKSVKENLMKKNPKGSATPSQKRGAKIGLAMVVVLALAVTMALFSGSQQKTSHSVHSVATDGK